MTMMMTEKIVGVVEFSSHIMSNMRVSRKPRAVEVLRGRFLSREFGRSGRTFFPDNPNPKKNVWVIEAQTVGAVPTSAHCGQVSAPAILIG
jgi:hypothetical protein